ncbi:aminopeptidase P N-terminal domain-containing protein [Sphingomonas sp.]|uniref:aminopeptidase P N-terminal domain-containing protein n=1 Tax=Sphingomonas sp. TaxID=28214 RepID=UPI0018239FA2|nr:aminopeptidase P N-terminal domain-containing protein [Sphingomonas sp.]MBA3510991.1 aminopeptidase P N-terminal domain-containing protein [Sphingomonas sp.]
MLNRRTFIASAAAAGLASSRSLAQPQAPRRYGYPAGTRPFGPEVYRERRRRLMERMKGGVAVVHGPPSVDLGATTAPIDRPGSSSDFTYLTGLVDEGGAALLLAPGERTYREFLFLPTVNPEHDRWEGTRLLLGSELRARTGFEKISRIGALGTTLAQIAARAGEMRYIGPLASPDAAVPRELDLYGRVVARVPGTRIVNNHGLVHAMRLVKEPRELELMRRAIAATERGMRAAMRAARPGMREFELKTIIESEFRAAGARRLAFPSIVGVARNSAVLHYMGGDNELRSGDLVLADIGAEFDFYAADITRTFPVDGRFRPDQRRVYETVLRAQEAAARQLRAGAVYEDLTRAATNVIEAAGHRDDFWHGLGHFVGLDVHDVGDYAQPLPAGAVLTIEPGIYLPERDFGIRIEDEYLVTPSGNEHLSRSIPRTVAEIEAAMAR